MASDSNYFLNKLLGEDFESMLKSEIYKMGTRSVVFTEDMYEAIKIVPRAIMSFLVRELVPMKIGENKRIKLPVDDISWLNLTCHERDVYNGNIEQTGKIINTFNLRSLPAIGLAIMSTFQLYDVEKLTEEHSNAPDEDLTRKVQHLIDERMALHDLIGKVVDRKIEQRDAIKQLIMAKLTDSLPKKDELNAETFIPSDIEKSEKKKSPLKGFLEHKKSKSKSSEFHIEMAKGEHANCDTCGKEIFDGHIFSGCICLGENMESKIYIKKTEEGIKIRFGRGWDPENIEMLLEVLRSNKNG